MTTAEVLIWCGLMAVGFAGSALFSGMETGAYRLNRVRLYVRAARQERAATILDHLIHRPAALLGTLLIGNNIANYLGTAALGVLLSASALAEWQVVVVNTLLVSLLLLVFGETLPKDLFAAHADRLMYPLAKVLRALQWVFTATLVLPAVVAMSRVAVRLAGGGSPNTMSPRLRVAELVRQGAGYGLLSDEQAALAQRALALSSRSVAAEQTPWLKVQHLRAEQTVADLLALAEHSRHSRFPVVSKSGKVTGTVDLIDALAEGWPRERKLAACAAAALAVPAKLTIRQALARLQEEHVGLAVVTDPAGRPTGIVTIKDLIEPLTGDIRHW